MQKRELELEGQSLETLLALEDLAEKKTRIYSRLLMDAAIAERLEELANRHKKRKEILSKLLYGGKGEEE